MATTAAPRLDQGAAAAAGRQLCELAAHVSAALAELTQLVASFDAGGGWGGAGIRSCPHWLSIQAGLDLSTSADLLRVGHALADLPLLRQAFAAGQLSLDKVRALIRVASPADEEVWLELALGCDASQLVRICRECRRSMDADAPGQDDRLRARRGLWTSRREDGMPRPASRATSGGTPSSRRWRSISRITTGCPSPGGRSSAAASSGRGGSRQTSPRSGH